MRFGNRAIRLYRAGNKDCPTHLLFGGLLGILHILPDKPELCCRTTCVFRESTVRTFRTKNRTINPFTAAQQIRQHILIVLHPAETHGTISQRWQVIDIFPLIIRKQHHNLHQSDFYPGKPQIVQNMEIQRLANHFFS